MSGEEHRVATLRGYGILDTPNEPAFDGVVRDIAATFSVPSALVSFIDEHRQWYKARHGVEATEVPRAISFCTHSLSSDAVVVVPDARLHPRFATNPNVTCADGIRFYAAAPIHALNRARIGTVCIFDRSPRIALSPLEERKLAGFAARVTELLEARRRDMRPAA
jgi:GAF domain-containing protein